MSESIETPLSLIFEVQNTDLKDPTSAVEGLLPLIKLGDQSFFTYLPLDVGELVRSVYYPRRYSILSCTCGHSGCNGIQEGILVTHDSGFVEWRVPYPLRPVQNDFSPNLSMYTCHYLGDIDEYREAIVAGVRQAAELSELLPADEKPPQLYHLINKSGVHELQRLLEPLINKTHVDYHFYQ